MRIAIVLNEHGEPAEFAADGDIELPIIDPNCPTDRVYRYGSVDALIDGHPIGHANDGLADAH
jgi:hypothetical protein